MKRVMCAVLLFAATTIQILAQEYTAFVVPATKTDMCKVSPSVEGKETAVIYRWEFMMPALDKILAGADKSAGNYRLGDENARLKDYVTENYTSTEPIAPGNPMTRIVIRKPAIFNAVKAIEKYYLAGVKKNEISQVEAEAGFRNVLQVAVAAVSENSQEFEEVLQEQRKDARLLIEAFNQVKLKQM